MAPNHVEKGPEDPREDAAAKGTSPYSTGGGGVTFERKVAVQYIAHLLLGDGAAELGDERRVVSVAFQQDPTYPVDDLVVEAARADENKPSLILAIAVRRAPDLVSSDESTLKLFRDFVRSVVNTPINGPEHRFALVVAGPQVHADQLAVLTNLASVQMSAAGLFDLVGTPNKFEAGIRGRLDQILRLVRQVLADLTATEPEMSLVQKRVWELLSKLTVLMPRLEVPDETDWAAILNSLIPVARSHDLAGASRLRDRLVALADEYPIKAASIDVTIARRNAHTVLDASATRRNQRGWEALDHLNQRAISSVDSVIVSGDGARRLHIDRGDLGTTAIDQATTGKAVVVSGESGVGKSAIVINASATINTDPEQREAVRINLRHLPRTTLEFETLLGSPLGQLLTELSAPQRILIVDGADAVAEGMLEQFRYLVDAARSAELGVIAITANDNKQIVRDTIAERFGGNVVDSVVPGLNDAQVDEVVATFGELANLAANLRSRELLRRPVVIDLFVRGGVSGVPLSDADAMQQVWRSLVRRREQSDRGTPEARDVAMLRLADLALSGGDALEAVGAIDPTALEGLRQDGLLRRSDTDPFRVGPDFAHDEVRRYAIARLFLADSDPTAGLLRAGVPRWALGAARLACQVRLAATDTAANPLRGRVARLQAGFDALVDSGYGERWGDVPGEALLTLGDPDPVIRDAWPGLNADKGKGLKRLCRLVDQRLRDEKGLLRIVAVEPLVSLLLEDTTPWRSGEHVQDLLRDWLGAHIIAMTPVGHRLRKQLGVRLIAACRAADQRLESERAAVAAARTARTPEEIKKRRESIRRNRTLFTESGYPRSRKRRPEVPSEITNKVVVELLALLGPDLGSEGEAILKRIGLDAPSWLAPAVEEPFTGRALAMYRQGFLAEITEAYYIDQEEDGPQFLEDGIRDHHSNSFGISTPLAVWYRGPFMALLQSDFRNGVGVLNRMLNHAALVRVRTLAGLHRYGAPTDNADVDEYRTELNISGARRMYVGDSHVWIWYRGTGVGPYPCMSALQALERVCDQLIQIDIPISSIVARLLEGCENLAMVGLVVGLLVRHLERTNRLLDPYLADPMVWRYEFERLAGERSGLAASSDGIIGAERRHWSLRDASTLLVVRADDARVAELRSIGQQLIENAKSMSRPAEDGAEDRDDATLEERLAPVRAWASGLDRDTYHAQSTDSGLYIQSQPPDDVVQALERDTEDLRRVQEAWRLIVRYHFEPKKGTAKDFSANELTSDLSIARDLLDNPPVRSIGTGWDAPTAVAATALSAHLVGGVALADELLRFALDTVLCVGAGEPSPRQLDVPESYFEQGADRSAARVLPLLLLPSARRLLALLDDQAGQSTYERVIAAGNNFTCAVSQEVRLHLARGLDRVWEEPCSGAENCHHQAALQLALESMRDCVLGEWDPAIGRRQTLVVGDPIEVSIAAAHDKAIAFPRLDAAIRALAVAAVARICVSDRARAALDVVLAAQRRSMLTYDRDIDSRGTHALVSARAILTLASDGSDAPILDHVNAFADNPTLLGSALRALSSAAEESASRAATARRVWPRIMANVLEINASGHSPFRGRHSGDRTLAALLPNAAGDVSYLYRELAGAPIEWWEPGSWREVVERWLPVAAGDPTCVDHLIAFLSVLPYDKQVRMGLAWIAQLVLPGPDRVAGRSFLLSTWLIESRASAIDQGLQADWQRIIDALVVAGVRRLAPYSE